MKEIEKAFGKTSKILLGRELHGLESYGPWLSEHVRCRVERKKSVVSGKEVLCPSVNYYLGMGSNVCTVEESLELATEKLSIQDAETLSLSNAREKLVGISTTTPEIVWGTNVGTEKSSNYGPTQYCFESTFCWFCKYVGYSFWPRESEYLFGCSHVIVSSFCMRCSSSTKLTRCFEVSDSNNCTDCYFCHNCENVRDSMFCFNAKNLQYAIGNREVGREAYMRIKKMVLDGVGAELEKEKKCRWDIYEIGCES